MTTEITVDLGKIHAVNNYKLNARSHTGWGIYFPGSVDFLTSTDGQNFFYRGTGWFPTNTAEYSTWTSEVTSPFANARYVKMKVYHSHDWMMIDYLGVYGSATNSVIKNAPSTGVLHGGYDVVPYQCGAGTCWALNANGFEQNAGAGLALVLWYGDWSQWTGSQYLGPSNYRITHHNVAIAQTGRSLLLGLVPAQRSSRDINVGLADRDAATFLADAALRSKGDPALGLSEYPIWFRLMNEMDIPSHRPEVGSGGLIYGVPPGEAHTYVRAYQRIFNIAQQVGAVGPKHAWVWSPAECCLDTDKYYPGDGYVDWAGLSVYSKSGINQVPPPPGCGNSFTAIVSNWSSGFIRPKPLIVTEGAAENCTLDPNYRGRWLTDWFSTHLTFPRVKAVVYFNDPRSGCCVLAPSDYPTYQNLVSNPAYVKRFVP